MEKSINIKVRVWRQASPKAKGAFETYELNDISTDSSFLEMLDVLNEKLISERKEPITFDHDCREGICGMCSLFINGRPHGNDTGITTCQLHMPQMPSRQSWSKHTGFSILSTNCSFNWSSISKKEQSGDMFLIW